MVIDKKKTALLNEKKESKAWQRLKRDKWLYVLLTPGVLYYIIFCYLPMWGICVAFMDYQPMVGFAGSKWVGLEHFKEFFSNPEFFNLLRNTLIISFMNLLFYFPAPIVLALLLNEIKHSGYKRIVQTFVYVPHFISMIIIVSITHVFLTTEGGIINLIVQKITGGEPIPFLTSPGWFRPLILIQNIWKETGWGTIIFLAALAGVEVEQYEAAIIDGASRFKQLIHITLPSISSTIIILLILRMGSVLNTGFEQIFLMTNSLNRIVGEVFDTYVYQIGIKQGAFSYSTAVGLFKSLVGIVLILSTDKLAKKFGHSGLY